MGINFQNVSYKYSKKASTYALKNINLSVESTGEFIFIVGHTGSGKTTLVQHLNALLLPTEGYISFNNSIFKKGTSITLYESTGRVAYVIENYVGKNYIEVKTILENNYGLNVVIEKMEPEDDKEYGELIESHENYGSDFHRIIGWYINGIK